MSLLIISSVLVVFVDILYPLTPTQRLILHAFDLGVVVILALDYVARLRSSTNKKEVFLKTSLRTSCNDPPIFNRSSR